MAHKAKVESGPGGSYIIHGRGRGPEGTLVQTDCDFPGAAQDLGLSLRRVQVDSRGNVKRMARTPRKGCPHSGTDGTVKCPDCKVTASDFISAAAEYLDSLAT